MPKLNRIRIANVSYDGKYILDQIFDTYGGENTLFNLANGSGKSVLVQMMLQPILPCQRIHDRKIESYLSKTSSPTYIMLEWKLDNAKPDYFLTGIAMCSTGQGDEAGTRVKFFTFTHRYDAATKYDIANTPLIERHGNGYKYMPYDEAFNLLKNAKYDPRPLHCYARDHGEAYQKNLEEHGIFQKEWKLLARVNNREGGVDEVFADCKSSDALLNKWILKTIADKTEHEEQNLREMFQSLMTTVAEQEDTIREKEVLSGFLGEIDKLLQTLSDLSGGLDEAQQIERLLSGLHTYLNGHINKIEEEKQACSEMEHEQLEAKQRIRLEQLSESWHNAKEEYSRREDILEKQKIAVAEQRNLFDQAKRSKEVMAAAGHKKDILDAVAGINALQQQIDGLKEWSEEQETRDILFSLDWHYSEEISRDQEKARELTEDIDKLEDTLRKYTDEKTRLDKEKQVISERLGTLKERLAAFVKYEDKCQKTLGFSVRRNMAGELDTEETEAARKRLSDELNRQIRCGGELSHRLKAVSERRNALLENQKVLSSQISDIRLKVQEQKQELDKYLKIEEKFNKIVARERISVNIKDIPQFLSTLRERGIRQKIELNNWETLLVHQRERLTRFNTNSLHTAREFGELLKSNGIAYITGEDHLRGLDADRQKAALSRNPMLPFCFLVGKNDFDKASSLYIDGVDRICPVMVIENADGGIKTGEEDIKTGEYSAHLTDYVRAMCYYMEESFAPETKDSFKDKLEKAIAQTEKSRDEWQGELERLKQDIAFLEEFPYDSESRQILTNKVKASERTLQETEENLENEAQEIKELEISCDRLRDKIAENGRTQQKSEGDVSLFEEYLSQNMAYVNDISEQEGLERRMSASIRRYKEINNHIEDCNNKRKNSQVEKAGVGLRIAQTREKHNSISAPAAGELLDWPVEALERRHEEIKNKQSQDERHLLREISYCKENKNRAEKQLKKFKHLTADEIDAVSYNEELLELLEKEEKRNEQLLRKAEIELGDAKEGYIRAEAELASRGGRLREEGCPEPLPMNEIKGDYDTRHAIISNQLAELELKVNGLEKERKKCESDANRILRIIENPVNIVIAAPDAGWQTVAIDEQSSRYKIINGEISGLREIVHDIDRDMRSNYKGRHTGIDNLLATLSIVGCERDYETCYAIFERLSYQRDILGQTVRILESQLEHLDKYKENVVYHAFAQGKRVHAELKKISESSRVKLSHDKPRQQTLKIGIPDELDPYAEERVRNHVNACIDEMRSLKKKNELTEKMTRNIIDTKMSDREILNQTIGPHPIDILLLKIDASHAHTKLRKWENVLTDNSGGELFVACFALLSALMDYSRKSALPEDVLGSGAKVMLIDNPFGKTSSNHLLNALIQIAKQFNMQMICLSDLSQSSITSKFALIYQLSVRPAIYGGKAYLKIDSPAENVPTYKDSRLEHASLRSEQMRLF